MTSLQSQFDAAAQAAMNLPSRPDNEMMLRLYAFFKQAKSGDVTGNRPGIFDMVGRAKHDAWAALRGTPCESAMRDYVALVESLK